MPSRPPTFFLRLVISLAVLATSAAGVRAEVIISEFMAANTRTLADEDGTYSDWIELHNPDTAAVNLEGWSLTDAAANLTKWRFPAVTLAPGAHLVIFASNKDRRAPGANLHTNFALSAGGEYLGLIKPDGVTVAFEYAPSFPAQEDDVSYGVIIGSGGAISAPAFLSAASPGSANGSAIRLAEEVSFSRSAGPFQQPFQLELAGASAGQQIRYTATSGASVPSAPDPTATSAVYTGPITISSSTRVKAAVFSADGASKGRVAEVYFAKLGASLNNFASQLPVIVIDSLGTGPLAKDNIDHPSWAYVYPSRGNSTPVFAATPELVSPLTTTVRGSSSADFPKKGYNVAFTDATGARREQAFLDLPAYEKWALVAPWAFDQTYINNAFVYALSNRIGRWAPRTRLAEVFFNADGNDVDAADYAGVYVITDRIEVAEGRVDLASLSSNDTSGNAVTGGYILKMDMLGADEIGWDTERGIPENGSTIVLVTPDADDIAPAQLDYIRGYVQAMENALAADQAAGFAQRTYLDYVDRASWVDHHLLNTFVRNPDAFTRSAYFTKDRGGKLTAGPVWDFDRALGSYWDPGSTRWDVWTSDRPDYWRTGWWGMIAQDPEFMQDWIDRWQSLRTTELATVNLRSLVDSLAATVGTDAANRDATRWPDNVSPFGSYAAQIDHLRNWVTQRAQWIDQQFLAPPAVAISGSALVFTAPAGAELAYTLDGSDPRALGGEIAPNAQLTSGPLSVPANANVHVRSYRASLRGTFPGSPWSSAVGGDASSPLLPKARLVNISSRAVVGAGENSLIAGVVVADTKAKRFLSRAVGPGLAAFGASGTVPDPQLSIFAGNSVEIFRNNGWESGPDAARLPGYARAAGAFPLVAGSSDSALANELSAGTYTVQVTTPSGQDGVGLAELYELDTNGRTVNLSTRAFVRTGDGVLIGGFVVAGSAYKRMLVRAVGPTLTAFGVTNALLDPMLTIYSGSNVIATNDRWEVNESAAATAAASRTAGAFALAANSEDSALLITLPPGAYTVEVRGKDGAQGVALLEIYEVP